ncbi:tyrosine--tRNA ligase [candidate division WWE3 bacterium CG_4_9_14_3_um_filter_41_6]|uniref:tyrosine--tRNA ligase n=1 Tax=candidate division WWE3 bacterium CG_4_10_14_0_2_um_filter_41_14 TaxID=1975072 RepID=A0A2M7TKH7_UNCKA|nr:MAG: tyrosine--tRNA ligase [candidate division WWE3 bacterium CG_4_10_14_0_2_um_filter_41_14]PJA39027.1 MAG: tyrosine--tRNA ligase [candidate division WWE3 bacterium CG_4_9_14_3_um_filter_41_6]
MDVAKRLELIKQVGEEITTEEELKVLLNSDQELVAYDGFEPSGKIHLPQGLMRAVNINKMIDAGVEFTMLVADWHAWANHKMGGDLGKIQKVGEYFIEVWKASGLDTTKVEFVWASDVVKKEGYWDLVMKIAVKTNLARVLRTTQIMGRGESDTLTASQILYPLMQAADIFMLEANITQLGMDQRKVNMLAREVAEELGYIKPIVVSHHMLLGLTPPDDATENESTVDRTIRLKMSKSKPDSAIFMTDTRKDIERKIQKAWAPEAITHENPILEYCKYVIFAKESTMEISRLEKFGGDVSYVSYEDLEHDYANKKLFPLDLKSAVIEYIDGYLTPVRKHFEENEDAKKLKEEVESFEVTR